MSVSLAALQAYPPRVVKLLAAFGELKKLNANAVGYRGLLALLPGSTTMSLRLTVGKARELGLVETVREGKGRGAKSAFALTQKGLEALGG